MDMYKMPKNVNLNKYPKVKEMFERLNKSLENEDEEITTIDFRVNGDKGLKKEYALYKQLGIEIEVGGDCCEYFKNYEQGGLPPSHIGYWTTLYMRDIRESAFDRLEYFLENDIYKPFRMETWIGEYPNRESSEYNVNWD